MREKLVAAILSGEKTASAGLLEEFRREGVSTDAVGTRAVVVDSNGDGVAIIENVEVEIKRMADVDLAFAIEEGEGFQTLEDWRDTHVRFFTAPEMVASLGDPPVTIDDDTLVVCFRFRLVEVFLTRSWQFREGPPTARDSPPRASYA